MNKKISKKILLASTLLVSQGYLASQMLNQTKTNHISFKKSLLKKEQISKNKPIKKEKLANYVKKLNQQRHRLGMDSMGGGNAYVSPKTFNALNNDKNYSNKYKLKGVKKSKLYLLSANVKKFKGWDINIDDSKIKSRGKINWDKGFDSISNQSYSKYLGKLSIEGKTGWIDDDADSNFQGAAVTITIGDSKNNIKGAFEIVYNWALDTDGWDETYAFAAIRPVNIEKNKYSTYVEESDVHFLQVAGINVNLKEIHDKYKMEKEQKVDTNYFVTGHRDTNGRSIYTDKQSGNYLSKLDQLVNPLSKYTVPKLNGYEGNYILKDFAFAVTKYLIDLMEYKELSELDTIGSDNDNTFNIDKKIQESIDKIYNVKNELKNQIKNHNKEVHDLLSKMKQKNNKDQIDSTVFDNKIKEIEKNDEIRHEEIKRILKQYKNQVSIQKQDILNKIEESNKNIKDNSKKISDYKKYLDNFEKFVIAKIDSYKKTSNDISVVIDSKLNQLSKDYEGIKLRIKALEEKVNIINNNVNENKNNIKKIIGQNEKLLDQNKKLTEKIENIYKDSKFKKKITEEVKENEGIISINADEPIYYKVSTVENGDKSSIYLTYYLVNDPNKVNKTILINQSRKSKSGVITYTYQKGWDVKYFPNKKSFLVTYDQNAVLKSINFG